MNIWLIKLEEPLPFKEEGADKCRTGMLAERLIKAGHSLVWWVSAFSHYRREWIYPKDTQEQVNERLTIYALKGIAYRRNVSLKRFISLRLMARKFRKIAPSLPLPDIIVASLPPYDLSYEAVSFAKKNNIPILVDIRDQWPDIFLDFIPSGLRCIAKALLYRDFAVTKKTLQLADGLLSMMNSLLDWGLGYAARERTWKDKVFYLGFEKHNALPSPEAAKFAEALKDKFVVVFISAFGRFTNPHIVIEAAKRLAKSNICFVLVGDGELFLEAKKEAGVAPGIIFTGWLGKAEIINLLKYCHAGLCASKIDAVAFPNKAFAYLSAGLPVISALQGDLKEYIEKYRIGFYYPYNNTERLVECIRKLYADKALYREYSLNARRLFDEFFDADKIYEEFRRHIEKVAKISKQAQYD